MLMIIALMFISLAALLHVYIFYLEVFAWEKPAARKVFGEASVEELAITRFFAYNQGVYNLLLAIIAGIGVATGKSWRLSKALCLPEYRNKLELVFVYIVN